MHGKGRLSSVVGINIVSTVYRDPSLLGGSAALDSSHGFALVCLCDLGQVISFFLNLMFFLGQIHEPEKMTRKVSLYPDIL